MTMAAEVPTPVGEGSADLCWVCAHYVVHHGLPVGPIPEKPCGCSREEILPAHVIAARNLSRVHSEPESFEDAPTNPRPSFTRDVRRDRGYLISQGMRRARVNRSLARRIVETAK